MRTADSDGVPGRTEPACGRGERPRCLLPLPITPLQIYSGKNLEGKLESRRFIIIISHLQRREAELGQYPGNVEAVGRGFQEGERAALIIQM